MTTIKCDQCGKEITDVLIRLSATILPNPNAVIPMVYRKRKLPEGGDFCGGQCVFDFVEGKYYHG